MSRANALRDLQQVDLKRDEQRAMLAKIAALLKRDGGVAAATDAAAAADARQAELEQELRRLTLERDAAKDHVAREEKQLYGGKVRVAKELQNLELEVASLRRQLKTLDDQMLDLMIQRDEASELARQTNESLAEKLATAASQNQALIKRQGSTTEQLGALDNKREHIVSTIPASDLHNYERLRKAKGGRAVSDLVDGTCGACGILLPQQDAARAVAGASIRCAGCGRIVLG